MSLLRIAVRLAASRPNSYNAVVKYVFLLPFLLLGTGALLADVISDLRPRIREEAGKRDVDPILLEAILRHESAHGTSKAARNKNNLAGIKSGRSLKRYESKEESVAHLAIVLERYNNKGVSSPRQLAGRYCATSPRQWEHYINLYMTAIKKGNYGELAPSQSALEKDKAVSGLFSQNSPSVEDMGEPEKEAQ